MNEQTTAYDVMAEYYRERPDVLTYFGCRYYIPKYISQLSLLSILESASGPFLDIGCGAGHGCGAFKMRHHGAEVIGIDEAFFGLFMAKRWIARGSQFVCCDLRDGIPFASGVFGSAFCSDTLHYIKSKPAALHEARRVVVHGGLVIMAEVVNGLLNAPFSGTALAPSAYRFLLEGAPHRCVSSLDILRAYRSQSGPPLAESTPEDRLATEKFLCLVLGEETQFRNYGSFPTWPHAEGTLQLSTLYDVLPSQSLDQVSLERKVPFPHFEARNPGVEFFPQTETTSVQALIDIQRNVRTAEVDRLIAKLLVYGTPPRYGRHVSMERYLSAHASKMATRVVSSIPPAQVSTPQR